MLAEIETLLLRIGIDAHADQDVANLEDNECAHGGERDGDRQRQSPDSESARDCRPPDPSGITLPLMGALLMTLVAKTPVRSAPSVPPAPCTPKASSVSS